MVSGRKNDGQILITVTRKFYGTVMAPYSCQSLLYRKIYGFILCALYRQLKVGISELGSVKETIYN